MTDEADGGENTQASSSELQIQASSEPTTRGKDEPSIYAKPSPVPVTLEMGSRLTNSRALHPYSILDLLASRQDFIFTNTASFCK